MDEGSAPGSRALSPRIVERDLGFALEIPEATPGGRKVEITRRRHRDGAQILHAESPDQSELYFEVTAYPGLVDHAELGRGQQAFLRDQSPDGTLGALAPVRACGRPGQGFDFQGTLQGRLKQRRFVFLDGAARTYRIVRDPSSPLNEQTLETLELL